MHHGLAENCSSLWRSPAELPDSARTIQSPLIQFTFFAPPIRPCNPRMGSRAFVSQWSRGQGCGCVRHQDMTWCDHRQGTPLWTVQLSTRVGFPLTCQTMSQLIVSRRPRKSKTKSLQQETNNKFWHQPRHARPCPLAVTAPSPG